MADSVFEIKKGKKKEKSMSLKIPADLYDDIENIKDTLGRINPDMRFNVNAICVEALRKAVRAANRELNTMSGDGSPTKDATDD